MALDSRIVIHANAKVIEMVERAKFLSDQLVDGLPGIFAVVRPDGEILRSNRNLAMLLGVGEDEVRGKSLLSLMAPQACERLAALLASSGSLKGDSVQVELPLKRENETRVYRFHVSKYGEAVATPLVTVLGTDVTELRAQERKFGELFNLLPFGLAAVSGDGVILEAYSAYTSWLLGIEAPVGQTIQSVFLDRLAFPLGVVQSAAFVELFSGRPHTLSGFRTLIQSVPLEFRIHVDAKGPNPGSNKVTRVINCQYLPVMVGEAVDRVLLILSNGEDT